MLIELPGPMLIETLLNYMVQLQNILNSAVRYFRKTQLVRRTLPTQPWQVETPTQVSKHSVKEVQ